MPFAAPPMALAADFAAPVAPCEACLATLPPATIAADEPCFISRLTSWLTSGASSRVMAALRTISLELARRLAELLGRRGALLAERGLGGLARLRDAGLRGARRTRDLLQARGLLLREAGLRAALELRERGMPAA